jgi:copper chaperone CopZ
VPTWCHTQNPRDGRRVYSALRASPGVVCARLDSASGRVVTRGPAALQDIVLVLKGLGLQANAAEHPASPPAAAASPTKSPRAGSPGPGSACPATTAVAASHRSSSMVAVPYPDLGYIADMKSVFSVRGMTCGSCVASLERGLGRLAGVKHVSVALLTETAEVLYDGQLLGWPALLAAIEDLGYAGSHVYTSGCSAVERSRRLFAVDMVRGSVHHSAFNCSSVISHTLGLISLDWVDDGSAGGDDYEGASPVTSVAVPQVPAAALLEEDSGATGPTSHAARRYGSLSRRHSFTGLPPAVYNTIPEQADAYQGPGPGPTVKASYDQSQVAPSEVVLQAVYDSQLVGLRTIFETMCALNPYFSVRLLPEKVRNI